MDILEKEEKFHDEWSNTIDVDAIKVEDYFEACTAPENRIILGRIGDLRDKRVLELGCGAGEASVYFAKQGADVWATDISTGMLSVTRKLAQKHNVKVHTRQSLTTNIDFPDETFDIVYAANLLHHVEIEPTVKEIYRVLKIGGEFYSMDPLEYNPLIKIYRWIASEVRTEDEHPIKMHDLRYFKKLFSHFEYDTTWFFTLWIFIKFYLIDKVDPNRERYWKKIIEDHEKLKPVYQKLEKWDKFLLSTVPYLKKYCWNIVIYAKK